MSFKDFINGFRKIEYTYELPDSFDKMKIHLGKNMMKAVGEVSEDAFNFPLTDVKFGIRDFRFAKYNDGVYYTRIQTIDKPILLLKTSDRFYNIDNLNEFNANIACITLGLDYKVWRFDIDAYFTGRGAGEVYREKIYNDLIKLCYAFIEDQKINSITRSARYMMKFESIEDFCGKTTSRTFTGSVNTYTDKKYAETYGLNDIVDILEPDSIIEDSLNEDHFDNYVYDDSLLSVTPVYIITVYICFICVLLKTTVLASLVADW